ncbi:hypothetical protein PG984_005490 [Apiospora sp. TS-2023a]
MAILSCKAHDVLLIHKNEAYQTNDGVPFTVLEVMARGHPGAAGAQGDGVISTVGDLIQAANLLGDRILFNKEHL